MELFIDDPNSNIDSDARNFAKKIHLIGFVGSIIPPLNFLLPYLLAKSNTKDSSFKTKHISNVLNFQFLFILLIILGVVLFLLIPLFYVLLYCLLLFLFQGITTYNNYSAAKNGVIYQLNLNFNFF